MSVDFSVYVMNGSVFINEKDVLTADLLIFDDSKGVFVHIFML